MQHLARAAAFPGPDTARSKLESLRMNKIDRCGITQIWRLLVVPRICSMLASLDQVVIRVH